MSISKKKKKKTKPGVKCVSCVQLLSLEEKLIPLVLSSLEEDAQTSRMFACRSLCIILELTGSSLHADALNKIYPRNCHRRISAPDPAFHLSFCSSKYLYDVSTCHCRPAEATRRQQRGGPQRRPPGPQPLVVRPD